MSRRAIDAAACDGDADVYTLSGQIAAFTGSHAAAEQLAPIQHALLPVNGCELRCSTFVFSALTGPISEKVKASLE